MGSFRRRRIINRMRKRMRASAKPEHNPMAALLPLASPVDCAAASMATSSEAALLVLLVALLSEVDGVGVAAGLVVVEPETVMLDGKLSIVNVLSASAEGSAIVLRRSGGAGLSVSELMLT